MLRHLSKPHRAQSRERVHVETGTDPNSVVPAVTEEVGARCGQSPNEDSDVWWGCGSTEALREERMG